MILILNIISFLLVLLNVFLLKNTIFGIIVFILWLLTIGVFYKDLIKTFFKNISGIYLFGVFSAFYTLCFFGSIFIVLYKITPIFFGISFFLTTFIPYILLRKNIKNYFNFKIKYLEIISKIKNFKLNIHSLLKSFNINLIILLSGILIFSVLIFFYLFQARSGEYNIYQFNNTFQLLWVLFGSLMAFILIYIFKFINNEDSKNSFIKLGLILIIFTSFIFHSTLPILYKAGFGGDRLRHAGAERSLQQGNIITPSLFGAKENVSIKKIGGIYIPEVLVVGNKQSYGNKYAADIFISWVTNIDVLSIDKYLIFLIWSIIIPFIFLNIGSNFTNNKKVLLLFSLSSIFTSPMLIGGSQSDPRSFGLLLFLFIIMLFLNKLKNDNISDKFFVIFSFLSFILLYFNYIVFLAVFIIFTSLFVLFNKINKNKLKLLFIPIFSLPILMLDLASAQTFISNQNINEFFVRIGNFFGNMISLKDYTSDIYESTRNFLYFRVFSFNNKPILPWVVHFAIIFSIIFLLLTIIGIVYFYKKQEKYRFVLFTFISMFLCYLISYSCFDGVRIFAKRTEIIISIFLSSFFIYGLVCLLSKIKNQEIENKINIPIIFSIVFCSLLPVSTLFSGPIMENVTENDFKAAEWVFSQVKNDEKFCIIGNTWPLLALEYVSNGKIVTGGFPQGIEYSQKERVKIFNEMIKNPSEDVLLEAKKITGANKCYLMLKHDYIKAAYFGKVDFSYVQNKYKELLKVFRSNKDIFRSNKDADIVKIFIE